MLFCCISSFDFFTAHFFSAKNTQEDEKLVSAIGQSSQPLRWSELAKSVPGRSGKQCRERYLNHLNPELKMDVWSPVEDATLFELVHSTGSRWAMMSRVLEGRSDNNIKNRFHQLDKKSKKDLECMMVGALPAARVQAFRSLSTRDLLNDEDVLKLLASFLKKDSSGLAFFGPFRPCDAGKGENCGRCKLFVPSLQTGRMMCERSGWCERCTRVPAFLSGDRLRGLLRLLAQEEE